MQNELDHIDGRVIEVKGWNEREKVENQIKKSDDEEIFDSIYYSIEDFGIVITRRKK